MIKKFLFTITASLLLVSCNNETIFKEVKVNNRYSISIPDHMQACVDLHKDASFQYQNTEKDIYAIVIDERKKTMEKYDLDYDLDLYFKNSSQPFLESLKNAKVSEPTHEQINGNKALVSEITGNMEQTSVCYRLGVIETPYAFYQVLTWTSAENKDKYEADMMKLIHSFKELPQPATELPPSNFKKDSV